MIGGLDTERRRRERLRRTRELIAVRRALAAYPLPPIEAAPEPVEPVNR